MYSIRVDVVHNHSLGLNRTPSETKLCTRHGIKITEKTLQLNVKFIKHWIDIGRIENTTAKTKDTNENR